MGLISLATRFVPRPILHRFARFGGYLLSLFLRGNRYEDPLDGYHYRRLLTYGRLRHRKNALAPREL